MRRRQLVFGVTAGLGSLLAGCTGNEPDPAATETPSRSHSPSPTTSSPTTDSRSPSPTPAASTPTVVDRQFSVLATPCRDDTAVTADTQISVETAAEQSVVTVTGGIDAPSGCYTAQLSAVTVSESPQQLRIDIDSMRPAETAVACKQCLVTIRYELRLTLTKPVSRIVVRHDGESAAVRNDS